jgi:hypothetical protein
MQPGAAPEGLTIVTVPGLWEWLVSLLGFRGAREGWGDGGAGFAGDGLRDGEDGTGGWSVGAAAFDDDLVSGRGSLARCDRSVSSSEDCLECAA